jgi:hypothetical protein
VSSPLLANGPVDRLTEQIDVPACLLDHVEDLTQREGSARLTVRHHGQRVEVTMNLGDGGPAAGTAPSYSVISSAGVCS